MQGQGEARLVPVQEAGRPWLPLALHREQHLTADKLQSKLH